MSFWIKAQDGKLYNGNLIIRIYNHKNSVRAVCSNDIYAILGDYKTIEIANFVRDTIFSEVTSKDTKGFIMPDKNYSYDF